MEQIISASFWCIISFYSFVAAGSVDIVHESSYLFYRVIKMVNKQEFENYKAELEMLVGIKITKAIAKFNESISVTSENNEVDIIQRLTNEN